MDAQYLTKNVNAALTEALTSMAVSAPEDRVEYLGRYLLQYVKRREIKVKFDADYESSHTVATKAALEDEMKIVEQKKIIDAEKEYTAKFPAFITALESTSSSKKDAMDKITHFIAEYFKIPASYIAIKKVVGETETLHYLSANPGQEHVVGRKIVKVVEEGDEIPERQGISFDAFKLPEVPEGEAEEEVPEGEEPPPPKPAPKPVPLIVENVMRQKRCKFFGIPKLGAYAAIPVSLHSIDHDAGCVVAPAPEPVEGGEEGAAPPQPVQESPYAMNKLPVELIIAMDTIGSYRTFKPSEIALVEQIGIALVKTFLVVEENLYKKHVNFQESHKQHGPKIGAVLAPVPDAEAAALAQVAAEMTPDPAIDPPPEPEHETLKPYKEADAVLKVWTTVNAHEHVAASHHELKDHVLPAVAIASNLLYAVGVFVGMSPVAFKDVCGDISWEVIRTTCLKEIHAKVQAFKPSLIKTVSRDASVEGIKAFCEANALFDVAAYPPSLPSLAPLCMWFQKAIAAREAAITYFKEAKEKIIETVV